MVEEKDFVEVNVKLLLDDYVRLMYLSTKKRRVVWTLVIIAYILGVLFTVHYFLEPGETAPAWLEFLIFFMILFGAYFNLKPYLLAKDVFQNDRAFKKEQYYKFSATNLTVSTDSSMSTYTWNEIFQVYDTNVELLISPGPHKFYLIPKRFITEDQLSKVRRFISEGVPGNKHNIRD